MRCPPGSACFRCASLQAAGARLRGRFLPGACQARPSLWHHQSSPRWLGSCSRSRSTLRGLESGSRATSGVVRLLSPGPTALRVTRLRPIRPSSHRSLAFRICPPTVERYYGRGSSDTANTTRALAYCPSPDPHTASLLHHTCLGRLALSVPLIALSMHRNAHYDGAQRPPWCSACRATRCLLWGRVSTAGPALRFPSRRKSAHLQPPLAGSAACPAAHWSTGFLVRDLDPCVTGRVPLCVPAALGAGELRA